MTNRPGLLEVTAPDCAPSVAEFRDRLLGERAAAAQEESDALFVIYKLTDACNFRCVYCYDRSFARPKESAKRNASVRAVLDEALATRSGRIHVLCHGGEPLQEFDEIRALVEEYSAYGPERVQFTVQTNGSLLTEEIVAFLNSHGVGLSVSVDGVDREANALRIVGGRPEPYALLRQRIDEIEGLSADRLGLLVTVGSHNVATLPKALVRAQQDGFRSLSLSFMQEVGPGARGAGPQQLVRMLAAVVRDIVAGELNDLAVWTLIEWVHQVTARQAELTCMTSPCGAGRSVVTVLPSGEVGPCDSIFDLGYYAPDPAAYSAQLASPQTRLGALVRRPRHPVEPCRSCDVGAHCNGTCPGSAILQSGDPLVPAGEECAFHYAWIIELMWALSDPDLGPGLLRYCAAHTERRQALRAEMAGAPVPAAARRSS
ncbi:radical SAM protein [Kitasatospora sp. NPDC004531]